MGKEESIGTIEWLLKTRKYTEQERDHIITMACKNWGLLYDKASKKFKYEFHIHQFGLTLHKAFYDLIPENEEENYAM
ncbi:hypothetical protein FDJ19_gp072 [Vibrio phage Ceto]|uniref:Uncharacterized protein n=1 Tax=Vibrio phage Ceto TaxID=2570300 RepID=A0A2H5BGH9_9CAUD|nr:hypothetical protein FDJ19_gp072 [Vibrio phage Ceto]AUG85079.1 hypothetical protein CETO_72 [Vibrio phage Ceto]